MALTPYIAKFLDSDTLLLIFFGIDVKKSIPQDIASYKQRVQNIASPREVYARIMTFREEKKLKPGEIITKERLDMFYDMIDNLGEDKHSFLSRSSLQLFEKIFPRKWGKLPDQSGKFLTLLNTLP